MLIDKFKSFLEADTLFHYCRKGRSAVTMRLLFAFEAILFGQVLCAGQETKIPNLTRHIAPTQDTLHNSFFLDDSNGWVISHNTGLVLHTSNGGKIWKIKARLGEGYLESIFFLDKKRGFIGGDSGRIYQTADGGANWKLVGDFAKTAAFYTVYFFNKQRGFAAGIDAQSRQALFFETLDGGKTWRDRKTEVKVAGFLTDAVYALDKKTMFVGGSGYVLRTKDGGEIWRALETKVPGAVRGLFFQDKQVGWAVGQNGLLLKTTDGGETWEKQQQFSDSLLRSAAFTTSTLGFVVGNRDKIGVSLWSSIDGGKNWQAAKENLPDLHKIVVTRERLWIFGASGTILSITQS